MEKTHSDRYILGNGVVADGESTFIDKGALLINNGLIEDLGPVERFLGDEADFIDVQGRLILPGFLNPHHHLYSSLAAGIRPKGPMDNFIHILEHLWWPLDKALDMESVYISALLGIVDSVKHGVTMIFDHHASMNFVRGSLSLIRDAFEFSRVKGLLCFEVSDRMGTKEAEDHIGENLKFFQMSAESKSVRSVFGLHANLTLSDETLQKIARQKPEKMPVHVHCGEDATDLEYCINAGYQGPVDRLNHFGLLSPSAILAHAVHLSDRDFELLDAIQPLVVTNPESNANNRVGRMNRKRIRQYLLGTDGMSGDMTATLRSHYLLGGGVQEPFDAMEKAFFTTRYRAQQTFFPETGAFRKGVRADIAVLDYIPITPISSQNLLGHLIFGAKGGHAFMTISDGNIIFRDGKVTFIDEKELNNKAMGIAKKLHERYYG